MNLNPEGCEFKCNSKPPSGSNNVKMGNYSKKLHGNKNYSVVLGPRIGVHFELVLKLNSCFFYAA